MLLGLVEKNGANWDCRPQKMLKMHNHQGWVFFLFYDWLSVKVVSSNSEEIPKITIFIEADHEFN